MMKRTLAIVAISGVLCIPASAQTKPPPPVPVFVTSVGAVDGFTDPNKNNQDTAKDLRESLKDYKEIILVDTRDRAAIVLIVQGREKAQLTVSAFGPGRDCAVRVKFQFKDMETEMSGSAMGGTLSSGGAWGKAAGKVAKQVRDWIRENRDKLR